MLGVMRDEYAAVERRDEMARAAAPSVHPRFATVTAYIETEPRFTVSPEPLSAEEWVARHGGQ